MTKKLVLHLPKELKISVDAHQHNFFNILRKSFENRGFLVSTKLQSKYGGAAAQLDKSYHIFNINGALGPRSLNLRQAHFYPYWALENAGNRYAPRIAQHRFAPSEISGIAAQDFFNKMCVRHLPAHPETPPQQDFVFIPLQGRLLKQRDWQFATTKTLIQSVLANDKTRQIIIKPHPREKYSKPERSYIQELSAHPRITISTHDTYGLLQKCAYVVTQNSAVAFSGFLYQKPAILFAKSDFHHICQTVSNASQAETAFRNVVEIRPEYEKYLYWYLQKNCINAGRDGAENAIINMVQECGWQV